MRVLRANAKDWEELDASIKDGFDVHFVEWYDDVYELAFATRGAGGKAKAAAPHAAVTALADPDAEPADD